MSDEPTLVMHRPKQLTYESSSPNVDRFAIFLMILLALLLFTTGLLLGLLIGGISG